MDLSRRFQSIYYHLLSIVIKSLFILWNNVPSALVLNPLNWIWLAEDLDIFFINTMID